jgi:hypothetical protein
MTMSPIGCASPVERHRRRVNIFAVTFSLLCLAPTAASVAEPSTSCRDEVAAAFERLKTLPHRKEETIVVSDQQTAHEISEFLPPDRIRKIENNGVPGYGTSQTIWVGQRVWSNWTGWPWGWRAWDPFLLRGRGMESADMPIAADAVFECLGRVEFEGKTYLGYRSRIEKMFAVVVPHNGALSDTAQQELERKLRQMPQEWRTFFVDPQTTLPAHDLAAQENKLGNPSRKVQYSYPTDIKIEPPLWCRLGLCRSILK